MFKLLAIASSLSLLLLQPAQQPVSARVNDGPAYAADGNLMPPERYREWVFLTSGVDMTYAEPHAGDGPSKDPVFDNVFANPTAYRGFLATGVWPEKTVLVLEIRRSQNPVSINRRGHTQSTSVQGIEIHVKDKGGWLFYDLPVGGAEAKLIPKPANCYSCHEAHAAADTTFVQFYPTLLPVATAKKTLSPEYVKEMAAPAQ